MNFYVIRLIFLFGISILLFYLKKRNKINHIKMFVIGTFICGLISVWLAPESFFLKFENVTSAFKYTFPTKKILSVIEQENYTFVVYQNDSNKNIVYFKKNNGKWLFSSPVTFYKIIYHENQKIYIKNVIGTNDYFVYIDTKSNKKVEVIDSSNVIYKSNMINGQYDYYSYIKNMSNNYFILIDNQKVKVQK